MRIPILLFTGGMANMIALLPAARGAEPADPADAAAVVPAAEYRSAFSGYEPFRESQPGAWRELNDTVGRLKGHAGHVQEPAPPPATGNATPARDASGGAHE